MAKDKNNEQADFCFWCGARPAGCCADKEAQFQRGEGVGVDERRWVRRERGLYDNLRYLTDDAILEMYENEYHQQMEEEHRQQYGY